MQLFTGSYKIVLPLNAALASHRLIYSLRGEGGGGGLPTFHLGLIVIRYVVWPVRAMANKLIKFSTRPAGILQNFLLQEGAGRGEEREKAAGGS